MNVVFCCTHRVVSDVLWRVFEGWSKVNGNLQQVQVKQTEKKIKEETEDHLAGDT